MKIALCSSYVPFIKGGYRNIVEWLELMLLEAGHQVERIYLPHVDDPHLLFEQMAAYRWVDLTSSADRIICFRPPAHLIPHPHKILWFIHHIRIFYDLWGSAYQTFPSNAKYTGIREALHAIDTAALQEAQKVFTNSKVVSDRLKRFNRISSEVLYPPIYQPERFYCQSDNDEIVYICRVEHHKRQHLLIEALKHTCTKVKLRLCGVSASMSYTLQLNMQIIKLGLSHRVTFENRWINEKEKTDILANCLAAAYLPLDEDSYGYPSLEASHSKKPILTTTDSGGVIELVEHGFNGLITDPDPKALAQAMDKLYLDRQKTREMGKNAEAQLTRLDINWPHVLERILL